MMDVLKLRNPVAAHKDAKLEWDVTDPLWALNIVGKKEFAHLAVCALFKPTREFLR